MQYKKLKLEEKAGGFLNQLSFFLLYINIIIYVLCIISKSLVFKTEYIFFDPDIHFPFIWYKPKSVFEH